MPMRNIFKIFGLVGKNPGEWYPPLLSVFGWRNTLGVSELIYIEDKLPLLVYCDLGLNDYYKIVIRRLVGRYNGATEYIIEEAHD